MSQYLWTWLYLLHRSLKNLWGCTDTVWHPQLAKPPKWSGKSGEKRGISVQFDLPKSWHRALKIQFHLRFWQPLPRPCALDDGDQLSPHLGLLGQCIHVSCQCLFCVWLPLRIPILWARRWVWWLTISPWSATLSSPFPSWLLERDKADGRQEWYLNPASCGMWLGVSPLHHWTGQLSH